MSTQHATRAPGDIVAVPEHLVPALRAAACERLADACRQVADRYDDEPLGLTRPFAAAVNDAEHFIEVVTRLSSGRAGIVMVPAQLEEVVAHALRMQDHDAEALAEEHTAEAFDELERRGHVTRRLRILQHDLTTSTTRNAA
jgi:hypothetical protein